MTAGEVAALADGSIYTGRQALARKLVDTLGGEQEALDWLASKGVDPNLRVVEWKPKNGGSSWPLSSALGQAILTFVGAPQTGRDLIRELGGERIFLDGLLSLWHPEVDR